MRDRLLAIDRLGSMVFSGACNDAFSGNLMLIDSMMENIVAMMLLEYYKNGVSLCSDIATALEEKDPLGYHFCVQLLWA